jgi:hypothetical protein
MAELYVNSPLIILSIRMNISIFLQYVARGPSLTGLGNLPVFTPAHQVEALMGNISNI